MNFKKRDFLSLKFSIETFCIITTTFTYEARLRTRIDHRILIGYNPGVHIFDLLSAEQKEVVFHEIEEPLKPAVSHFVVAFALRILKSAFVQ